MIARISFDFRLLNLTKVETEWIFLVLGESWHWVALGSGAFLEQACNLEGLVFVGTLAVVSSIFSNFDFGESLEHRGVFHLLAMVVEVFGVEPRCCGVMHT